MITKQQVELFSDMWVVVRSKSDDNTPWFNYGKVISISDSALVLQNEKGCKLMINFSEILKITEKIKGDNK